MSREAFQIALLKARDDWRNKIDAALIEHKLTGDISEETLHSVVSAEKIHAALAMVDACPTRFAVEVAHLEVHDWPCMKWGAGVRCTHPECKP